MNKLLKDAIADAKAVRETALANAKLALEEAFQPKLQRMFSEKIKSEMEDETMEGDTMEAETSMEAAMDAENEAMEMGKQEDEMARMKELAGLNEFGDDYGDDEEDEFDMDFDEDETAAAAAKADMEDTGEFSDEEEMEDEEMEDEEMEDEDLEEIIRQLEEEEEEEEEEEVTGGDMEEGVHTGRIVPGEPANLQFTEEVELDEEIDLDEVINALREEDEEEEEESVNELIDAPATVDPMAIAGIIGGALAAVGGVAGLKKALQKVATGSGKGAKVAKDVLDFMTGAASATGGSKMEETSQELEEAYSVIEHLREKINEVNLLNAKLLYVNKIFKKHNLTEDQKLHVVETFDRASTVRETKLVFTTLSESLAVTSVKKNKVMEGFASAPVKKTQILTESNSIVNRFQKLAGLTNNEE